MNDLELMEESQEYDSHIDNDPKSALNALKCSWAGQILVTTCPEVRELYARASSTFIPGWPQ